MQGRSPLASASRHSSSTLLRLLIGTGLAATVALGLGFVAFFTAIETAERPPTRHADGIVVLTGGADRVTDALTLLLEGHADRLLVTGVNPSTDHAEIARQHPTARAVVTCCVDLGYEAVNTIGNARETAAWARAHAVHSLIVVTSNYHMPRALAEISAALPGVDLQPYSVVSERARAEGAWLGGRTRLIASEYVKYLVALTRLTLFASA